MNDKLQYEVLNWASLFLEENNREPRVAELLLQHHLNVSRTQFYTQMRETIPVKVVKKFEKDIMDHAKTGKPIQHFTGYEWFYGRKFNVNEHVLIPRPETEELIEHILPELKSYKNPTIIDVGTGSGIIAITLALECLNATIYATDISKEALEVAKKNAAIHHAEVTFLEGDFLQPVINHSIKAEVIVSNPPYISEEEKPDLSDTVVNFDPKLALFADDNGLAAYKTLAQQAPNVLQPNGMIALEIGYTQGEAVSQLFHKQFPNQQAKVVQDINGKDRMIVLK